jgi:hypothetical protein
MILFNLFNLNRIKLTILILFLFHEFTLSISIDSKQGKIKPAKYIRKGGWHSDTFGTADPDDSVQRQRRDMTKIFYPKTADGLFKMLEKKREPEVTRDILQKLLDPNLVLDEENKTKLINLINSEWTINTFVYNLYAADFKRKLFLK